MKLSTALTKRLAFEEGLPDQDLLGSRRGHEDVDGWVEVFLVLERLPDGARILRWMSLVKRSIEYVCTNFFNSSLYILAIYLQNLSSALTGEAPG